MTYREAIFMCLDLIRAISNDSLITEEHVLFTINHYRSALLKLKIAKEGIAKLSLSNFQTICIDLERTNLVPTACSEEVLKSVLEIPTTIDNSTITLYPKSEFVNITITPVSKERFRFVGYNKYMRKIVYTTLSSDNHIYLKGNNPLFLYLKQVKVNAIFEDALKAASQEYSCEEGELACNIYDLVYPLEASLISDVISLTVKELLGVAWRLLDSYNNSSDDLANLIAYLTKNVKSDLAKLITL